LRKQVIRKQVVRALLGVALIVTFRTMDGSPQEMVGGAMDWRCVLLGAMTGVAIGTQNYLAAAGFAYEAYHTGCLW
jgi:hypothetical protein